MIVTDITEASKSKYKVFIDGEFSFVLYKGELRSLGIKKDREITEEVYREITGEILPKRAKLRAMHLLEKRPYTEAELSRKLRDNQYSEDMIRIAIDYVKSYGYVDDEAYAMQYINTYADTKTIRQIEQKLLEKGIKKLVIENAFQQQRELGEAPDERAMIERLLEKKGYDAENADIKERQKLARFLFGKGFGSDLIYEVLGRE